MFDLDQEVQNIGPMPKGVVFRLEGLVIGYQQILDKIIEKSGQGKFGVVLTGDYVLKAAQAGEDILQVTGEVTRRPNNLDEGAGIVFRMIGNRLKL